MEGQRVAKNSPAFQFYPADFLGGVMAMSDEACGVYVKLLCAMWIAGGELPYCKVRLAKCASTLLEAFERVWPEVEPKFVIATNNGHGVIRNARLTQVQRLQELRAIAGSKGGKSSQAKHKAKSKQGAPMKSEERRLKSEEGRPKSEDWVLPNGWDTPEVRKALDDWAAMRRRIGKPVRSKESTSKVFKRFASARHLIEVCEVCEANEWQGLKPEYVKPPANTKAAAAVMPSSRTVDPVADRKFNYSQELKQRGIRGDEYVRKMEEWESRQRS